MEEANKKAIDLIKPLDVCKPDAFQQTGRADGRADVVAGAAYVTGAAGADIVEIMGAAGAE